MRISGLFLDLQLQIKYIWSLRYIFSAFCTHFPCRALISPVALRPPVFPCYTSQCGTGCYRFLLPHLPSGPGRIHSPKALVLKIYFNIRKYVWQGGIDQWCLRITCLHTSLIFVYVCVFGVLLLICLFNYIYGHLCPMDCGSSFTCVILFGGSSMLPLPLEIPYFRGTSSRTVKTTAHMNFSDTIIKRLGILKIE